MSHFGVSEFGGLAGRNDRQAPPRFDPLHTGLSEVDQTRRSLPFVQVEQARGGRCSDPPGRRLPHRLAASSSAMVTPRCAALSVLLFAVTCFVRECGAGINPRILVLRGGAPGHSEGRADGGNGKGAQIAGMEGRAARFASKNAQKAAGGAAPFSKKKMENATEPVVEPLLSPAAAAHSASHSLSKGAPVGVRAGDWTCPECKANVTPCTRTQRPFLTIARKYYTFTLWFLQTNPL